MYFLECTLKMIILVTLLAVSVILPVLIAHFPQRGPVTNNCLRCISCASTGCNTNATCKGNACGMLAIQHAYWVDAGRPTILGEGPDDYDAFFNCVTEPKCAGRTVRKYIHRYGRDCNADGKINCIDYAAIHQFGPYACKQRLPPRFKLAFYTCMIKINEIW